MVRREGRERESESEREREEKRRRERVSSVHQNDTHGPVRVMTLWSVSTFTWLERKEYDWNMVKIQVLGAFGIFCLHEEGTGISLCKQDYSCIHGNRHIPKKRMVSMATTSRR